MMYHFLWWLHYIHIANCTLPLVPKTWYYTMFYHVSGKYHAQCPMVHNYGDHSVPWYTVSHYHDINIYCLRITALKVSKYPLGSLFTSSATSQTSSDQKCPFSREHVLIVQNEKLMKRWSCNFPNICENCNLSVPLMMSWCKDSLRGIRLKG